MNKPRIADRIIDYVTNRVLDRVEERRPAKRVINNHNFADLMVSSRETLDYAKRHGI